MVGEQRGEHVVGVRRLAQVVGGAALDGFHRGGDARIAGEDHHAHLGVQFQQLGQQHQAGFAFHLQVEHRVVGQVFPGQRQALLGGTGDRDPQAAAAHGARHDAGEGGVVVHQQQVGLLFAFEQDLFAHGYFLAGVALRPRRNYVADATRSECRHLHGCTTSPFHRPA
ncbi:hypothetical protein D3C76_1397150 [compost metagenome]